MSSGSTALVPHDEASGSGAHVDARPHSPITAKAAQELVQKDTAQPSTSPQPTPQSDVLMVREQFHGTVTRIDRGEFRADIRLLRQGDGDVFEATFSTNEISEVDRELLTVGAQFRWVIGRRVSTQGRDETVSSLYIRRLPKVTARMLRRKDELAEQLVTRLQSRAKIDAPSSP